MFLLVALYTPIRLLHVSLHENYPPVPSLEIYVSYILLMNVCCISRRPLRKWIHDKRAEMTNMSSLLFPANTDARKMGGNVDANGGGEKRRRDEEHRKRQKKEYEEKFKLMHRHLDPFQSTKDNENVLKSLLGMPGSWIGDHSVNPLHTMVIFCSSNQL